MPSFLSALCLLVCLGRCWVQGVDTTLTRGEIGKDVVDAVVAKIEASDIFPTDNRLLHRIAYVESKYGMETLSPTSCRNDYKGGIWQVDEAAFMRSKDPTLLEFHDSIEDNFDDVVGNAIEWIDVTWCDLRMPFYSGLAARLLLHLSSIEEAFPAAGNIAGQAAYWKEHYNGDDSVTVEKFEEDVTALGDLEEESCEVYFDLIFVLDSSGSINNNHPDNYNQVRAFVHNFVNELAIGPEANQVGVIIFGVNDEIVFNLSTSSNKSDLLKAVNDIPYLNGGATNTGDALRTMLEVGFSMDTGAREMDNTILRIGIVLTDGHSNTGEPLVNVTADVHAEQPPILVYAIGVGTGVDSDELDIIASEPGFIDSLESFDPELFQQSQEQRTYELCFIVSVPTEVETAVTFKVKQGKQVRRQYPIPEEGITITLCVNIGHIVLYASITVPNPGEAYYDYKLDCIDCNSCEFFVNPDDFSPSVRRKRSEDNSTSNSTATMFTNFTLYISMEGVETNNTVAVQSDIGDTTSLIPVPEDEHDDNDIDDTFWILIGAIAGGELILMLVMFLVVGLCIWQSRSTKPKIPDPVKHDSTKIQSS